MMSLFPVVTEGRNGAVLRVNAAAEHLLGFSPENVKEVFQTEPDCETTFVQVQCSTDDVTAVVSEVSRSGTMRDLLVLPLAVSGQSASGASFADLPVPIICVSPDGSITEANRLAVKLIGEIQPGETNLDQIMEGLGYPILDWLQRTAAGEPAMRSEFLRLTRQDKEVFVQVTLNRGGQQRANHSDRGFE